MENIILHFMHIVSYLITKLNQIGASTQTGLRTIPTPGGTIFYVRKFGTPYLITDVIDIEDPVDVNMTFKVYALDGTLLGSRVGGGAYVDGAELSTAQGCYMEIVASGGDVTVLNNILVDTDIDVGGLDFITAQETIYDGDTLTLYLSDTSSTYYNLGMSLGGGRHSPVGNNSRKPFFHVYDPINDGAWGNEDDGIEIVDSEIYSFPYYSDDAAAWVYELPFDFNDCYLYSIDGQDPKIKGDIGASTTREVSGLFNNETAVFFNENGTNVDTGATGYEDTWHDPYGTIANAITAATGKGISLVIYGGTGAIENAIITITAGISASGVSIEPEKGYAPKYITSSHFITLNGTILGFILEGINDNSGIRLLNGTANVFNCTIFNFKEGIYKYTGIGTGNIVAYNNKIYDCEIGIGHGRTATLDNEYHNNQIYNCTSGIRFYDDDVAGIISGNCISNQIYNCTRGFYFSEDTFTGSATYKIAMNFKNNFIFDCDYGFYATNINLIDDVIFSGNQENFIIHTCGIGVYYACHNVNTLVIDYFNFTSCTIDTQVVGAAIITNNNEIVGDSKICKITSPYKFGISANSVCHKAGSDGADTGPKLRLIEINADDIEINGIQFDGNSQFNNAIYIADTAEHTGLIIKWCNVFNFQGIAIDPYDDDTNTDCIISNNKIYDNGNGIKLSYGGNTLEYNLIYNNSKFGIWADYTGQKFNHNVSHGNQYGLYLESNSGSISIKNCIFNLNSLYGIYSEVNISITYCCIADAINGNVDITDTSNTTDDPLFVNANIGTEDFHIKTKKGGNPDSDVLYNFDSVCKDAADDSYDIGSYLLTRVVSDDYWKKYQLANDPTNMDRKNTIKSQNKSEYASGSLSLYGKSHKKVLPLIWNGQEYSTEEQYDVLEYISSLIQTIENQLIREQTKIRMLLLPDTHIETGSSATIDATLKTLTLSSKNWIWNKFKGWWVDILFLEDASLGTELFYAGFETDITSEFSGTGGQAWRSHTTPGLDDTVGALKISPPGGIANNSFVTKPLTLSKNSYTQSMYIDIINLTMTNGDVFRAFLVFDSGGAGTEIHEVEIQRNGALYQIRINMKNDAGALTNGTWVTINKTIEHFVQVIITRAITAISSDGFGYLYIDGVKSDTITGIDNYDKYASIDIIYCGMLNVDVGTSGDFILDEVYLVEGDAMLIDSTKKTATIANVNWTADQWIGYVLYHNYRYYYILDNDSNQLVLSDPDDTLVSGALTDWQIQQSFRIVENNEIKLTVLDPGGKLISGTYNFVIDFMEVVIQDSSFGGTQLRGYDFEEKNEMTGYAIITEES